MFGSFADALRNHCLGGVRDLRIPVSNEKEPGRDLAANMLGAIMDTLLQGGNRPLPEEIQTDEPDEELKLTP